MIARLPVLLRSAMYALRSGYLIRPLVIAMILGASGAVVSSLEEAVPGMKIWIPSTLFPSHEDPGVAQVILFGVRYLKLAFDARHRPLRFGSSAMSDCKATARVCSVATVVATERMTSTGRDVSAIPSRC
jgi:hypothetical protein